MDRRKSGLVSIVVPVYNAGPFIAETIYSVQAQTYRAWELLLVDDCSQDNSREIIRQECAKDERLRLVVQEENGGTAKARNRGVQEACGQYLCFLDADDLWLPEKLETQLEQLRKIQETMNPRAGFVFMGYEFADASGKGLGKVVHVPEQIHYRQALKNTGRIQLLWLHGRCREIRKRRCHCRTSHFSSQYCRWSGYGNVPGRHGVSGCAG